ncbi:MAG: bifunctional phosphopantothenoylcysteine decarboxylase/phosphopantothenate--cysteine ligase CoaBC [Thermodesulfobacteriota bacterium]|nr:bifunctional phosphopantothenoylcysteine decarboxylase/phosphopantothenate--cysteine ligase CoaBC [Thermodesulfobacteriota bacterium]
MIKGKSIVLGITGGIAAYKSCEIVRDILRDGGSCHVIMTKSATKFITPLTLRTLSGNPVITELFDFSFESHIAHISLADLADLFIIAPATANFIGKVASGIADDILTTTVAATKAPIMVCPSMNSKMYENPIFQRNLNMLASLSNFHILDPAVGELACGVYGKGRLPEPEEIVEEARCILEKRDLVGEKVLVTAGPTEEALDPVRFITNRSSGKMGFALARVAMRRGAKTTLISGPVNLQPPRGVNYIEARTALEMKEKVLENFKGITILIKAAAVADFRPEKKALEKMKKKEKLTINLVRNPDILSEIGKRKGKAIVVGFAAETEDLLINAKKKLEEKKLDLIVANDVTQKGAGFYADTNIVKLIDATGNISDLPLMSKEEVAEHIFDKVLWLKRSGQ